MTQPAIEAENLESLEAPDDQPEELDPVEERFAELKAEITDVRGFNQKLANQVGYIGRQLEDVLKRPQTAARDERVDELLQRLEDMQLANMDAEEKANYLLEQARKKPAPKAEEPKPRQSAEDIEGAQLVAEYEAAQAEWAEYAEELKLPWVVAWPKIQAKLQTDINPRGELRRGDATANDRHGWRPLTKDVKALLLAESKLLRNQQNRTRPIETERGAPANDHAEIRRQYAAGEIPFSKRVQDALNAV